VLHLLHPALVHFSVALLVLGGVGESVGILTRRRAWEQLGGTLVLLGTASLLPTVVTGLLAQNSLDPGGEVRSVLDVHERVGFLLLGSFTSLLLWKAWGGGRIPDRQRAWFAIALLAAVGLVVYGAYLGGQMVYGWGLGVTPS
jgi:uncharacterized membrane protein